MKYLLLRSINLDPHVFVKIHKTNNSHKYIIPRYKYMYRQFSISIHLWRNWPFTYFSFYKLDKNAYMVMLNVHINTCLIVREYEYYFIPPWKIIFPSGVVLGKYYFSAWGNKSSYFPNVRAINCLLYRTTSDNIECIGF